MKKLFLIIGFFLTAHLMVGQMMQRTISDGSVYSIRDTGGNLLSNENIFPEDAIGIRMILIAMYVIWGFVWVWKMTIRERIFSKCDWD